MSILEHASDASVRAVDAISFGVLLATISTALPPIAAFLTIVWTLLRIWESPTVRGLLGRRKGDFPPE